MRHRDPVVYILASARNGTIYIGVTADLITRLGQHRSGEVGGFTKKYHVHLLVHVEWYGSMPDAIAREKQLKKWNRARKIALIEACNPTWRDLYADFAGPDLPR
jgi:putative endonuclease